MITYKEWFVILSLATRVLGQGSEMRTPTPEFSYELNPASIQPGEHATLTLSTSLSPDLDENSVQLFDELLMHQPGLKVLEKATERSKSGLTIRYQLTSYKDAILSVPPVELRKAGATYSTEGKRLTVKSARPIEDEELRAAFGSLALPKPWWKWTKMAFWFLLGIGLCLYVYQRMKRRDFKLPKLPKITLPRPLPKIDHGAWLKAKMKELQQRLITEPENESLVDEWSDTIREYYARTTPSPARALTTSELKRAYNKNVSFGLIAPHLESCDNFKFRIPSHREISLTPLIMLCIQQTERSLLACGT